MSKRRLGADFEAPPLVTRKKIQRLLVSHFKMLEKDVEDLIEEHDKEHRGVSYREKGTLYGLFVSRYLELWYDFDPSEVWMAYRAEKGRKEHFSAYGSEATQKAILKAIQADLNADIKSTLGKVEILFKELGKKVKEELKKAA
jgi:hypothetical protein